MNNKELASYRIRLFRDAMSLDKTPERIPHLSLFVTWKIIDAGYKLSEAMSNWDVMEKVVCKFEEKYRFDGLIEFGHRNNYLTGKYIGESYYIIDDDAEAVNYKDVALCHDADELLEYVADPLKFVWEKGLSRKYSFWDKEVDLDNFNNAYKAQLDYIDFMGRDLRGRMPSKLYNDYGVPYQLANPRPTATLPFEIVFSMLRGIKGVSIDMRRTPEKLDAALAQLDQTIFKPAIARMKAMPAGTKEDSVFDNDTGILGHTILNEKQFEKYYWPYLKEEFEIFGEKGWVSRLFSEGASARWWDLFRELPKSTVAIHLENDDVFEAKKALPNFCIIGGMKNSLLGNGTKEECVSMTKKLIDEMGPRGYIMSQDKLGSYRNDANPENLKAVCDFVLDYQPSHD